LVPPSHSRFVFPLLLQPQFQPLLSALRALPGSIGIDRLASALEEGYRFLVQFDGPPVRFELSALCPFCTLTGTIHS
jgi:hypothetical protein